MTRPFAGMLAAGLLLAASLLLAGCAGIPVTMDPASFGRATVEVQNDTVKADGSKESCHAKAVAGMEASGVDVNADLCHGGDRLAGKASSLSGKDAQAAELDKWAALSAQQQQTALRLAEDALNAGGPIACAAVLTAVGFPAATPFCAALAGAAVPSTFAPEAATAPSDPRLEPRRWYAGPGGHVRYLESVDRGTACWRSGQGAEHCSSVADWLAWVVRPLPAR